MKAVRRHELDKTARFLSPDAPLARAPAPAADGPTPPAKTDKKEDAGKESLIDTTHSIMVGGSKLEYRAMAGTLPLKDDEGKLTANVFFVAYTKTDVDDLSKRPITFAFNGGPGSSSVWLHLGAFGPKRVVLGSDGDAPQPPYRLVDNEETLLDLTDLVFIDPVSTGYSRSPEPKEEKQFHGVEGDVHSVGDFIRLYVTRFNRWESPKFLAGESYGTTRAGRAVRLSPGPPRPLPQRHRSRVRRPEFRDAPFR